jgi:APA family basic amino acid/polyamine antiporter
MEAMYHARVQTPARNRKLGVRSGIGLVAANMIGAGVFLSAGFMAQEMSAGPILLAWIVGAFLALTGARAYAELARLVPRSGGEYRYLSELLHPALGYLSGWASLLVGFSAPVAVDALAAGGFAKTVFPALDPQWTGAAFVVALTALHVIGFSTSVRAQNVLIAVKVLLLAGFVWVGLRYGSTAWPTWTPPQAAGGFPLRAFAANLLWVSYAFAGWNAVVYVSEEFDEPTRTVPRAMLIGTILVALLYLVVNWIFVANLTPQQATVVFGYDDTHQATLAHAVIEALRGPGFARVMSLFTVVVFASAMSAMILVGPRVYQAMARDGYLPRLLAGSAGRPPIAAIVFQSALSLLFVFSHTLRALVGNVSAVLMLFSALTVLGLLRRWLAPGDQERPAGIAVAAAGAFIASTAYMLWAAFHDQLRVLPWLAVIIAVALVAWALTRRPRAAAEATGPSARGSAPSAR